MIQLCNENIYVCCFCNSKKKTFAFCDYYDQPNSPACKDCFLDKMKDISDKYEKTKQTNIDVIDYWKKGYYEIYEMYRVEAALNKQLEDRLNVLVGDKLTLRNELETIKRHIEFMERQIG